MAQRAATARSRREMRTGSALSSVGSWRTLDAGRRLARQLRIAGEVQERVGGARRLDARERQRIDGVARHAAALVMMRLALRGRVGRDRHVGCNCIGRDAVMGMVSVRLLDGCVSGAVRVMLSRVRRRHAGLRNGQRKDRDRNRKNRRDKFADQSHREDSDALLLSQTRGAGKRPWRHTRE
jgi:hypothetical protein